MTILELSNADLEYFRAFLDQQEAKLADTLLLATLPAPGALSQVHLHGSGHFRLTQALQTVSARIRELTEEQTTKGEWHVAVKVINQALWEYVHLLEESVLELIERIKHVPLIKWNQNFYEVVVGFKELLAHRIEDVIWLYKRLEEHFLAYRAICRRRKNLWVIFGKLAGRFLQILDKNLLSHLFHAEEKLATYFKQFSSKYEAFLSFSKNAAGEEKKFLSYQVFNQLPNQQKMVLLQLSHWISIWDQNSHQEALKGEEIAHTIKVMAKPGTFTALFKEYAHLVEKELIRLSRKWQDTGIPSLKTDVVHLREELKKIEFLTISFREILLRSDANPHVRTSWTGATKEPRKTRELLSIIKEMERLERATEHLERAIDNGRIESVEFKQLQVKKQLEETLHEMGQPLSSRSLIQTKAEMFVELIDQADELGGSAGNVHLMLTEMLVTALRLDNKYQVLNDYPRFREIFAIHQAFFEEEPPDREHVDRMRLFQQVIKHIEHWLKERELNIHFEELQLEEAAIQEMLQKVLGTIQSKDLTAKECQKYLHHLLSYRELFNTLYSFLRGYGDEGTAIRRQFHFVDQYLDAIEKKLLEAHTIDSLRN